VPVVATTLARASCSSALSPTRRSTAVLRAHRQLGTAAIDDPQRMARTLGRAEDDIDAVARRCIGESGGTEPEDETHWKQRGQEHSFHHAGSYSKRGATA
jgi:hypothetical protein